MRNFDECAEVKSIILEGMIFFDNYKVQRSKNSEITILLVLGRTKFLKLITSCVISKNPLLCSVESLKMQIDSLQKEIDLQVSKHSMRY